MSRRTSEASKAIRKAWEKEQELVTEGKGTRDWTTEQQNEILEFGKAYYHSDDPNDKHDGDAFIGHHMKSAEAYPEYQGDPDNIQFLSYPEHQEAHKGNWQIPSNWYYDPVTKEYTEFGEGKYIPCEVISLSEPVRNHILDKQEGNSGLKESSKTRDASSERTQSLKQEDVSHHTENTSQKRITATPHEAHESFGDKILHVVDAVKEFSEKHPVLTGVLKAVSIAAAAAGAGAIANSTRGSGSESNSSSSDDYYSSSSGDDYSDYSSSNDFDDSSSDRDYPDERSSPEEHTVPAHGQHYHTKDGVIWKEKESYQRGGKHDDD